MMRPVSRSSPAQEPTELPQLRRPGRDATATPEVSAVFRLIIPVRGSPEQFGGAEGVCISRKKKGDAGGRGGIAPLPGQISHQLLRFSSAMRCGAVRVFCLD